MAGRPLKNNAEWFSHDKDMRNHRKIKALRQKHGITGYAVFCMILEVLTHCEFSRMFWDESEYELLAGDFGVPSNELKEIVSYCVKLKLFTETDTGAFYSTGLLDRLQILLDKREVWRKKKEEKGIIQGENTLTTELSEGKNQLSPEKIPQTKLNYTKPKREGENKLTLSEFGLEEVMVAVGLVMESSDYTGQEIEPRKLANILWLTVKDGVTKTHSEWHRHFQKLALQQR